MLELLKKKKQKKTGVLLKPKKKKKKKNKNHWCLVLMSLSVHKGHLFVFRGEEREWVRWLPHFLLLIAQQLLGGFSSKLAYVCSSPRINF